MVIWSLIITLMSDYFGVNDTILSILVKRKELAVFVTFKKLGKIHYITLVKSGVPCMEGTNINSISPGSSYQNI